MQWIVNFNCQLLFYIINTSSLNYKFDDKLVGTKMH
jgi:hypothetical protein